MFVCFDWQIKDPRGIFLDGLNLKMKGIRSVETSVTIYHSTRRKIPENLHLQQHLRQKLTPLKVKNFPSLYHNYGSLSCSEELASGPYPSARWMQSTSPYRMVVLQAFLISTMSVIFCLNSMCKPDVRLQCIRKVCGYLSIDRFLESGKYSLTPWWKRRVCFSKYLIKKKENL